MSDKLDWVNYISIDGADPVLLDSLSDEERDTVIERMEKRLSQVLSIYLSDHPEDLKAIFERQR